MNDILGGRLSRHGITYPDAWFVYAGLADTGKPIGLVKVGISVVPLDRLVTVHCNSPYPIRAAMWAMVGGRTQAARAESRIKKAFADKKTRGEWFEFDFTDAESKRRFNSTMRALCEIEAGMKLKWTKIDGSHIAAQMATGKKVRMHAA